MKRTIAIVAGGDSSELVVSLRSAQGLYSFIDKEMTRSSELMERSRQSRIEEYIATKESDLQTSTNPPYLLK